MPNNSIHINKERVKIYRDIYRSSSNILNFLKSLLSVIMMGQSLSGSVSYYRIKNQTNNRR
jgi:hypothetical protein